MPFPAQRPRRLRNKDAFRNALREVELDRRMFILPLFVTDDLSLAGPIDSMPGQSRWTLDRLEEPVSRALDAGISSFLLFGITEAVKKDARGTSALADDGVVPRAVNIIKRLNPASIVTTDVCLCAYTDHGHCGLLDDHGNVLNDETLPLLSAMALTHARAGADMIAPSDMMDGRVGEIRTELDENGFKHVPIMAYSVKYASAFYGPFRDAAKSSPKSGDRKSYQMGIGNFREAMREMQLDIEEGADILMVKPALPYLDIIRSARTRFDHPIAAYQVSGEFSMIKAASLQGWLDEKSAAIEALTAIHRAGADLIITYYAVEAAEWFRS